MYLWLKRYFSFTSYHAIKNQDDYLSRLSSEDGDYEEMKEETKQRSTKMLWRILLVLSLLVFASALFDQSTRFRLLSACQNSCAEELRASSSNKKALDPVGMIPEITEIFQPHEKYMKPASSSMKEWDDLLPPGRGFVFVPDSGRYGLKEGQQTQWGEIFSVSLFHQLHCLGLLWKQYWTLLDRVLDGEFDLASEVALKQSKSSHTGHCFDYLRQAIMCAGDMSMEWPRDEPDGRERIHVDGWDIPHKCKDWNYIWQYMLTNGYNASSYNDIAV